MVARTVKRLGKQPPGEAPSPKASRQSSTEEQVLPPANAAKGVLPSETGRQVVPVVDESTGASAASRGAELAIAPWGVVSAMGLSKVPDADSTLPAAEVQQLVKRIAAHVLKALPEFFAAHKEVLAAADVFEAADVLEQKKPQEYQALRLLVAGKGGMVSYKAPWNADNAKMSLQRNGMCEASANPFWLNPFPSGQDGTTVSRGSTAMVSVGRGSEAVHDDGCGPGNIIGDTAGICQYLAVDFPDHCACAL